MSSPEQTSLSAANSAIPFGYDFRESRLKRCRDFIEALPSKGRFLDVGCTQGGLLEWARSRGWDAYGTDINPANIEQCRTRGLNVEWCDLAAQALPWPDGHFDFVFAWEIIEHLVDTDRFIEDVHRVLKPKGAAIITTPNLASFGNRLRLLFGRYPEWMDYSLKEGPGHVRYYTPRILKRQLESHRFRVVKQAGNFVPIVPQFLLNDMQCPPLATLGRVFPSLCQGLIVLLEKR